jgi:hypothetical protein
VAPPALYAKLVGTCWSKTNDYDDFYQPDQIQFGVHGDYWASYRGGECHHGGQFAIDGRDLVQTVEPNVCDLRGPTSASLPSSIPELLGDLLVFYSGTYRPASAPQTETLFLIDSYRLSPGKPFQPDGATGGWGSVRVIGRYTDPLTRGEPTHVRFLLQNVSAQAAILGAFSLRLQALTQNTRSFSPSGDPQLIPLHDWMQAQLQPGDSLELESDIVPAVWAQWAQATFELGFALTSGGAYADRGSFILPIREGQAVADGGAPPL